MNFKYMAAVFLTSLILFNCGGQINAKVVTLGKGEPAPYKGYLLSPESEKKARIALIENTEYKLLVAEQHESIIISQKMIENRNRMIGQLNSQIESNKYYNYFYFIGGALIGGLVVNEIRR